MIDSKFFEDMAKKLTDSLPAGIKEMQQDFEKNCKAVMQNAFAKLDLVPRQEFDVALNLLKTTRTKLEELEKRLAELEAAPKKSTRTKS